MCEPEGSGCSDTEMPGLMLRAATGNLTEAERDRLNQHLEWCHHCQRAMGASQLAPLYQTEPSQRY